MMTFALSTIIKIIYIFNIFLTVIISTIIAFSTNVKLLIFSQEVETQSLLVYSLVIVIILCSFYLFTTLSTNNILSYFILLCISIPLIITSIQIIQWFFITIEGPIHYRFFTIIKSATFDMKLQEYLRCVTQYILLLAGDNILLEDYLNNLTL